LLQRNLSPTLPQYLSFIAHMGTLA
jgi:hypothetical protein